MNRPGKAKSRQIILGMVFKAESKNKGTGLAYRRDSREVTLVEQSKEGKRDLKGE